MTSRVEHTDVGAYALGLLEDEDRRAFEAHLRECGSCAAELGEMSGTAAALTDIRDFQEALDVSGPEPERPPEGVTDLLRERRRRARRARRGTYVIGMAAAAVLLATGVTIGAALTDDAPPAPAPGHGPGHGPARALVIWGERRSARDAGTGASGVVGLENKGWGTHVGLELRGVRGPLKCRLEAVSDTGERSVVTGWSVPPKGYGVPGSEAPLVTHGGTAVPRERIDRFEVVTEGGARLLTIPA